MPADLPTPKLSVIIPAYNEFRRIGVALHQIREYALRHDRHIEVVVVDDGSADETAIVVSQFHSRLMTVKLLRNEPNRGKGYSVKRGMLEASGDLRLMSDADMSTPMDELDKLIGFASQGFDVVIASRSLPGAVLDPPQPPMRRMLGQVMIVVRSLIFRGTGIAQLRDTQCGFKLFTAAAAGDVFALVENEGFAFDVEALAIADRLGYRIKEVAVMWRDDPHSTVRPIRDSVRVLKSLFTIRSRMKQIAPRPRKTGRLNGEER